MKKTFTIKNTTDKQYCSYCQKKPTHEVILTSNSRYLLFLQKTETTNYPVCHNDLEVMTAELLRQGATRELPNIPIPAPPSLPTLPRTIPKQKVTTEQQEYISALVQQDIEKSHYVGKEREWREKLVKTP